MDIVQEAAPINQIDWRELEKVDGMAAGGLA
jgi:hypothetical protein